MGAHIIKLREPASLTNGTTFTSAGVPCRAAQSITFLARATDANTASAITIERSNETADGWQTSLPAMVAEVGDAITAQTLNNSVAGTAAGRCRSCYAVSLGGIPFRQMRFTLTAGATTIAGLEVWAIVVDDAGDSSPAPRI